MRSRLIVTESRKCTFYSACTPDMRRPFRSFFLLRPTFRGSDCLPQLGESLGRTDDWYTRHTSGTVLSLSFPSEVIFKQKMPDARLMFLAVEGESTS